MSYKKDIIKELQFTHQVISAQLVESIFQNDYEISKKLYDVGKMIEDILCDLQK